MCGITGFFGLKNGSSPLPDRQQLEAMTRSLIHRGPDGEGYYFDSDVGLGHRRLSIIDLEGGRQPLYAHDGKLVAVVNGEIYNFKSLRRDLQAKGHQFKTGSDSEVCLLGYAEYGTEVFSKLKGMFAIAIYDAARSQLVLGRDRYGMKPLYVFHSPNFLAFSSELRAFHELKAFRAEINQEALESFLTYEHVPAPLCIFKNCYKIESGQYLIAQNGEIKKGFYYRPSFSPKNNSVTEIQAVDEIDRLLNRSIEEHLNADVEVGAFLSGGIDSSLVSAIASKKLDRPLQSFSIGFEDKSFDESFYSDIVAKHIGSKHQHKCFQAKELLDVLPKVLEHMDEPFADPSLLPTSLLSEFTRSSVKVALSGDAADEIFAGYPTYWARKVAHFIPRASAPVLQAMASPFRVSHKNLSFDFKVKKFASGISYDPDLRHQVWLGGFPLRERQRVLRNPTANVATHLSLYEEHMRAGHTDSDWERSLWADFRFYLQDNMLVKVDRASMQHGLEVRVPFLDHQLVDYASRLPSRYKYKGRQSKYLLKKLAERYLPEEIVYRSKKGFGIPISVWLKNELKDQLVEVLSPASLEKTGLFHPGVVQLYVQEHLEDRHNHRKLLWPLFVAQSWALRLA